MRFAAIGSNSNSGTQTVEPAYLPWAYYKNDFSIVIQIPWKVRFSVTPLWGIVRLHNFAHATTAQLSCHVQNFIATFNTMWMTAV